ncbi:MAG: hypothetical protein MJZ81_09255 [Bacteroidales bacterium]|nr:hypothetical protein [Bacteroidales bacterium]
MANEIGLLSVRRTVVLDADIDQLVVDAAMDKHMNYSRVINEGMRLAFKETGRVLSERGEREVEAIFARNKKRRAETRAKNARAALERAKKRLEKVLRSVEDGDASKARGL